ncbi:tripartite motif-containing protein 2-like [Mizuhopecten yessoensis]|uniref:E3 ubiquitin-protein ligase TRIM56 n=1 Tax=Mizuhopecten yessoensis TaxID=6573 RepID=A0A210R0N6_MIZYE|nr:tripartite motif-containing protein 2-like [Mizuhopecten yessoensis]XP_021345328.1 tripartite motif-containing protein 2-like [Mizuhopecten yessoensis]XP_021345329.1 tripartite motif-containing protein 2-like [Mizuhopecten yessoensis]OWF54441.1 E3 ubiquitin-protein ligase TRIM56 [Mizuhopecten yessoensis]
MAAVDGDSKSIPGIGTGNDSHTRSGTPGDKAGRSNDGPIRQATPPSRNASRSGSARQNKSVTSPITNGNGGNGSPNSPAVQIQNQEDKGQPYSQRMSDVTADSSKSPNSSTVVPPKMEATENTKSTRLTTDDTNTVQKDKPSNEAPKKEQETVEKHQNGPKVPEKKSDPTPSSIVSDNKSQQSKEDEEDESGGIFLTQALVTPRLGGKSGSDIVSPKTNRVSFKSEKKEPKTNNTTAAVSKSMEIVPVNNGQAQDDVDVFAVMDDIVKSVDSTPKIVCSVCDKTFSSPRILPCLHSLCFPCLDKVLTESSEEQTFPCPECKENIPRISPEFINNVYLEGILGVENSKTGESASCEICSLRNIKTPAKYECLDCVDLLCDDCGSAHLSTRATVDHRVVSLQEIATGKYDGEIRKRIRVKCRHHKDEPFESFCKKCNTMVCRECMIYDHRGHECVSLHDAHKATETNLMSHMGSVARKQREISLKRSRIDTAMSEINTKEQTLIDYVNDLTQQMIQKLNREREEVIGKLQLHMNVQRTECRDHRIKIDKELVRINSGLSFCHQVTHNGKQDEVLFMTPALSKRLKELAQSPIADQPDVALEFPNISLTDEYKITEAVDVFEFTPESEDVTSSRISKGFGKTMIVSFQFMDRINITGPTDYLPPKVTGLACTGNGSLVIADASNSNVKLFSTTGAYIDNLLTCRPVAVAACSNVVCISDRFSIQLVSTDRKFKRRIPLDGSGSLFAVSNFQMRYFTFVSPLQQMFKVYDTRGQFVQEFPMPKARRKGMHRTAMHITSNSKGEMLASDWGSFSIVHTNTDASVLHEYKCGTIGRYNNGWMPGALSVDAYDNVLVADQQNDQLMILSPDFKVIHKRKVRRDKLERPVTLASDTHGHYFVAGKGNFVNIYMCKYG